MYKSTCGTQYVIMQIAINYMLNTNETKFNNNNFDGKRIIN